MAYLRVTLIVILLCTLLLPVLRILPLSFLTWSDEAGEFVGPPTVEAYQSFFSEHRGGVVLENFILALVSALMVSAIAIPLLLSLKVNLDERMITYMEIVLVIPFLFSPSLRLFSLREVLAVDGPIQLALQWGGINEGNLRFLLYSDFSVCAGLMSSYAALLILPAAQAIKQVPRSVVAAGRDLGLQKRELIRTVLLPLSYRGILAGFVLMLIVCWFSSLEATILGRSRPMLEMFRALMATNKFAQSLAFALIPFALACMMLGLLAWFTRPEDILFPDESKDRQ